MKPLFGYAILCTLLLFPLWLWEQYYEPTPDLPPAISITLPSASASERLVFPASLSRFSGGPPYIERTEMTALQDVPQNSWCTPFNIQRAGWSNFYLRCAWFDEDRKLFVRTTAYVLIPETSVHQAIWWEYRPATSTIVPAVSTHARFIHTAPLIGITLICFAIALVVGSLTFSAAVKTRQ